MQHEIQQDQKELAKAILAGAQRRPEQAFGDYFQGHHRSCALGAAYEGMYRLPTDADGVRPKGLDRLFDCLEGVIRQCPAGCKKKLALGAIIVHLNDDHRWTREQIATWLEGDKEKNGAPDGTGTKNEEGRT